MKHLWILAASILLAACQAKADSHSETASANPSETYAEGDTLYFIEMAKVWKPTAIDVPGGGNSPDIVVLLSAFNRAWPTQIVSGLLNQAKDPKFTRSVDEEYGAVDLVDRPNGYAGANMETMADMDYMEACIWKRRNGHRLLAVCFGQPVDPDIEHIYFYDYNPQTQQLTPDEEEMQTFAPLWAGDHQWYTLPRQGKDVRVRERIAEWSQEIESLYTWDGQRHVFACSDPETFDYIEVNAEVKSNWILMWENFENPTLAEYALLDLDGDDNPELLLCEATEAEQHTFQALFTVKSGKAQQLAVSDRSHELTLLKNGCRLYGNADVGLGLRVMDHAVEHNFIRDSEPRRNIMCYIIVNDAQDGYDYEYSDNGIEMSEKDYDRVIEQVKEWNQPVSWRKLTKLDD